MSKYAHFFEEGHSEVLNRPVKLNIHSKSANLAYECGLLVMLAIKKEDETIGLIYCASTASFIDWYETYLNVQGFFIEPKYRNFESVKSSILKLQKYAKFKGYKFVIMNMPLSKYKKIKNGGLLGEAIDVVYKYAL